MNYSGGVCILKCDNWTYNHLYLKSLSSLVSDLD